MGHISLLVLSLLLLGLLAVLWSSPLTPGVGWKPRGNEQPIWRLIVLLLASAGLPYFVLSSTGPLLQSWFTKTHPGQSPYRLYGLSNLGSLLALVSYPFVVEPWLSLRMQARLWSWGFVLYVLLCAYCALKLARSGATINAAQPKIESEGVGPRPGVGRHVLWLALAMSASVMFLATTNRTCQDIGIVPFLWVVPLSLYLASFVICFDKPKWYSRRIFHPAFALSVFLACLVLNGWGMTNIKLQIGVYSFTLFVGCMVCHGELARLKPVSRYLTSFYLMIALGGAAGGVFVALIAPFLFNAFWEYQLGLWFTVLLLFLVLGLDHTSFLHSNIFGLPIVAVGTALLPAVTSLATGSRKALPTLIPVVPVLIGVHVLTRWGQTGENKARHRAVPLYSGVALLVLAGTLTLSGRAQLQGRLVTASRNFYGVLSVRELNANYPDSRFFSLYHGRISHGLQFQAPSKREFPTSYYGTISGAGRALTGLQNRTSEPLVRGQLRIGVVGLGIGTLAAYGRSQDYFRFYEINPAVISIARDVRYFTYLRDCPARIDVVTGDARISMEQELERNTPQEFDLLVLDAFSGDAVPVHLLTKQAFEIYLGEIKKPEGIIAVHITNTYLDLRPVLTKVAEQFGLQYALLHTDGDNVLSNYSDWVLLSYDKQFLNSISTPEEKSANQPVFSSFSDWTDDYSNLFQVLRR